jgi:hypothetical protein
MAESILTKIFSEIAVTQNYNASDARFLDIRPKIENLLNKRVVFYFASETGKDNSSMINDEDAFIIENLLSTPSTKDGLVLIIHSNGGYAISAERIIEVCKNYCKQKGAGNEFWVLVPKKAKSAATILALGADKIYLRNTAELGPVDPQFSVTDIAGNVQFIPAYLQVDAIENITGFENKAKKSLFDKLSSLFKRNSFARSSNEIKLKLLEQCNYALYVNAKNELDLSDSIIEKISKEKTDNNKNISQKDFDIFRDPHLTKSHGRLINLLDLKDNPLCKENFINNVSSIIPSAENSATLNELLWELYVRKSRLLNDPGNNIAKTIESVDEYFTVSGKKIGQ